jgi:hypothetical protein
MANKTCSGCKTDKDTQEFYSHVGGRLGLRPQCKACVNTKSRLYAKAHVEQRRVWDKNSHQKHKPKRNAKCRLYYRKNKDAVLERYRTPKGRFKSYKSDAKSRGLDFKITFDDFMTFWGKECFYCGDGITGIGMDRKDNAVGYEMSNIVACCRKCNTAKMDDAVVDFIVRCKKIAARFGAASVLAA